MDELIELNKVIAENNQYLRSERNKINPDQELIKSYVSYLAALQQEKNILLQRESRGNLFKLYTTNLI